MFDLGHYLPYLINRAGARLAVEFGREIRRRGIALQEWRVLAALADQGGQRLSDLAGLTSIDLSTLSRLVGRMVRAGLLSRERMDGDQREVSVALTDKGQRITRAIIPIAQRYERRAFRSFMPAEEATLKALLLRVYANLERPER
ncbi:MAG: MarR family transcriptional regulator [Alphaproteobacteria bacterium]|nr:MarR family transcriptional regulator [Alphaproteobacteria bacterium]